MPCRSAGRRSQGNHPRRANRTRPRGRSLATGADSVVQQNADYPAWSRTGDRFAFSGVGARVGVFIAPVAGGEPVLTTSRRGVPVWSPDGRTLLVLETPPETGAGSYNGDPDRLGDRDAGDFHPAQGHVWLVNAAAPPDSNGAEMTVRVTVARRQYNADQYDRFADREARLYFSTPDAADRRAQWSRLAKQHRDRALAVSTDAELDDAIWALERERPPLRAPT